jgi:hypothetical protein
MTRRTRRFPRLAIAIVAAGLMAPTSALGYTDLRSPDAVDAAIQAQKAQQEESSRPAGRVDLRSPDAVDAAIQAQRAQQHESSRPAGPVDLRSPDAVDTRFAQTPEPATIVKSRGFDWGDAGIGAGAVLGLLLIALSLMFTVVHHRNRTATV